MEKHLHYYTQHSQYETPVNLPSISYCENENEIHYYAPNLVYKVGNFQEFMEYLKKRTNYSEITPELITFKVYEYGGEGFLLAMEIGTKATFIPVMISGYGIILGPHYTYYPNLYSGKFEYNKVLLLNDELYDRENYYYNPILITDEILKQLDGKANISIYPGYE